MSGQPILGYSSRNQIREVLAGYSTDRIDRYFHLGDFTPDEAANPLIDGEERQLVERYYANIDFASEEAIQRFFVVLEEILHDLQPVADPRPWQHTSDLAEEHFGRLVRFLGRDGIEVVEGQIRLAHGIVDGPNIQGIEGLSDEAIREHIQRAKRRLSEGDYPSAIAVCYTLVETFLKAVLKNMEVEFKDTQGDIRTLYNAVRGPLGLDPAGDDIEKFLRAILQGLQSQVGGLYELANAASDRHDRKHEPQQHHAVLAVNTAFTLCEFLLGAYEFQRSKDD